MKGVGNHVGQVHGVEQVAQEFFVTTRTLERYFITVIGRSVQQEISRRRLEY